MRKSPMSLAISLMLAGGVLSLSACNESESPKTGVLLDAAVQGMAYTTSGGLTGTTDANGQFSYYTGDTVTFKIGNVTIGSAKGASKLMTNDLTGETQLLGSQSVRLARLLQSLDVDGNPANGIDIRNKTVASNCALSSDATLANCATITVSAADAAAHLSHTASTQGNIVSVSFTDTPAPTSTADMARTFTTSSAVVTYADGSQKSFPLSYTKLFGVKDRIGTYPAGQLYNRDMLPINDPSGQPAIAETPDANSLLKVGDKLYLVTHYEYDWLNGDGSEASARMPMSMTLTSLSQNTTTGALSATAQSPINFSGVNGLWIPCFGSQTPWNTHLGSEEDYDLQANPLTSGYTNTSAGLQALQTNYLNGSAANPYHYGFFPEVTVAENGSTSVVKHYAMGRGTWEMGKVMPDGKTVYYGDDGTNVGIFMFVADTAGDLSAGTLYAARWHQTSAAGSDGGSATLSWVRLGHATDAQVKALVDAGTTFDSIFNNVAPVSGSCPSGTRIRAGSEADECLSVKPGMETAAAFLETRRYAALMGATAEFTKMEGIAVNAKDKKIYMAMSRIEKGMKASTTAPTDHVQLKENKAGATYTLQAQGGVNDHTGAPIASDYVATSIYVEDKLLGRPISADALGNTANPDYVANTDNVFFSEKMRTLFIGEDSGMHVNNFVWAYNVDTQQLTRILSAVAGAENTGLQVVEDLNGHAYIMSNSQHHGDFISTHEAGSKAALEPMIDKFDASVGYIGGLPALR